jgi:gamma-glutamylputrescine oxidase
MGILTMHDTTYWYTLKSHAEQAITSNQSCDVVIIGGGMAGLSAAQRFAQTNNKVILLEQDFCGSGASGKSSGFVTPDSELELSTLIENYGPAKAKKLWEFVSSGVAHIRSTIEINNIECDFKVQDSLLAANSPKKYTERILAEHEARQQLGYESTLYTQQEMPYIIGLQYFGGVRYPDTYGINSYLYCQNVKELLAKDGVMIFEQSPVTAIEKNTVTANGYTVTAKTIIVCADRFLPLLGILQPHVYQAQTFLGLTNPLPAEVVSTIFPQDQLMTWDTDLIYKYFRIVQDNRLLIGAASMLYTYIPVTLRHPKNVERTMYRYLQRKCPGINIELDYFWPGLIGVSKDFVPLAGQDKHNPNLYYVSAATGLPWAAALGRYIAEKVLSGRNDFDEEFNPYRKYPVGAVLQAFIRKPITFALSHGITKYF